MSGLLIGLLSAMEVASGSMALTNGAARPESVSTLNDPADQEYRAIEEKDDAAMVEVDGWIKENQQFAAQGAGVPNAELNRRIRDHFQPVQAAYEDFIKRHPGHVKARLAFASFLGDIGDDDAQLAQLEKARDLDPTNAVVWNNLADYYSHGISLKQCLQCYQRATQLAPNEPLYFQNYGTAMFLFRKDARELYHINEQQVFDRALTLYSRAMQLDPKNFVLASDVAQTYYGIEPPRMDAALKAWTNALNLAENEVEREGVYVHFARLKIKSSCFAEAQGFLDAVTNRQYLDLKKRLERNLAEREKSASDTGKASEGAVTNRN